jgi:hypothetical protein
MLMMMMMMMLMMISTTTHQTDLYTVNALDLFSLRISARTLITLTILAEVFTGFPQILQENFEMKLD